MNKKKKGAVGIGTLIIFIAMVLVAAVAAAVLINVSGILQQKSMATGKEAIQSVSSNIVIVSIKGQTNTNKTTIENLTVIMAAAAGAGKLDLSQMVVIVSNKYNETIQKYTRADLYDKDGSNFTITSLRDPSGLFTYQTPVMDGSSLVKINIQTSNSTAFLALPPRSDIHLEFIPEFGTSNIIDIRTTASYSTTNLELYP